MIKNLSLLIFILVYSLINTANAEVNQDDPVKMVKELSEGVIEQITTRKEEFKENPEKLIVFARTYILPYVDTYKMARYVLGRSWKIASKKQQQDFAEAFTNALLNSYSSSLIKFKVKAFDIVKTVSKRKGSLSITTEITQENGAKAIVVYRAYQSKSTKKWMLYDFSIEGISMLVNYRKTFTSEVAKKGMDKMIADLKDKNITKSIDKDA